MDIDLYMKVNLGILLLGFLMFFIWLSLLLFLLNVLKELYIAKHDFQQIKTAQRASQNRERIMMARLDKIMMFVRK